VESFLHRSNAVRVTRVSEGVNTVLGGQFHPAEHIVKTKAVAIVGTGGGVKLSYNASLKARVVLAVRPVKGVRVGPLYINRAGGVVIIVIIGASAVGIVAVIVVKGI